MFGGIRIFIGMGRSGIFGGGVGEDMFRGGAGKGMLGGGVGEEMLRGGGGKGILGGGAGGGRPMAAMLFLVVMVFCSLCWASACCRSASMLGVDW